MKSTTRELSSTILICLFVLALREQSNATGAHKPFESTPRVLPPAPLEPKGGPRQPAHPRDARGCARPPAGALSASATQSTSQGIGRRGAGSFCERLLRLNTLPRCPMPLLVHFRVTQRASRRNMTLSVNTDFRAVVRERRLGHPQPKQATGGHRCFSPRAAIIFSGVHDERRPQEHEEASRQDIFRYSRGNTALGSRCPPASAPRVVMTLAGYMPKTINISALRLNIRQTSILNWLNRPNICFSAFEHDSGILIALGL